MTSPVVKIFKIPSGFYGIDDVLHKQCVGYEDIVEQTSTLYPLEQAVDESNIGNPGDFEQDPKYKILMSNPSGNYFYPEVSGLSNKTWIDSHLDLRPLLFVKRPVLYAAGTIWEYENIPAYSELGDPNYQVVGSGVLFNSDFVANNQDIFLEDIYASFFYKEDLSYVHPSGSNTRHYFVSDNFDYVNFAPFSVEASGIDVSSSGEFIPEQGVFIWTGAPSGIVMTITGFNHTWERVTNDALGDLIFNPGEKLPSGISDKKYLVKDFTENGPWYMYTDIKVVNESDDTALEKFFMKPVLRGKLSNQGDIYQGFAGYTDPSRPWDSHEGQAEETVGYTGIFDNTSEVCTMLTWDESYCWASGIDPYDLNPALPSGLNPEDSYMTRYKFPTPCSGFDTTTIITYYRSTNLTPDGRYAFVNSDEIVSGSGLVSWNKQVPTSAEFKKLEPGTFALDGFPTPDSVYARLLYTLRNFDYSSNSSVSNWSANPQFLDISESDGKKVFSINVEGVFYE